MTLLCFKNFKNYSRIVHALKPTICIPFSQEPINQWNRFYSQSSGKRTILYDFHVAKEGKLVNFAGYDMPVQYGKIGIAASHKHIRSECGIFDVSHMLQTRVYGKDRIKFIEGIVVGDILSLNDNSGMLTLFTNDKGGIIDDLICNKVSRDGKDFLYVVSNAGCRDNDLNLMKERVKTCQSDGLDVALEVMDDHGLIALQGPKANLVLQKLVSLDLSKLYFMNTTECDIVGTKCRITRCGYTGEDGFEISIHNDKITEICEMLLESKESTVQMAGLGARDSLRLEAGLCLYGNDIDASTTPIEAGLAWTIGKRRREMADFPGAKIILNQLKEKPKRRRVGFITQGPPPRSHSSVLDAEGSVIGEVTSGCPSPSLGVNVAMAYVPTSLSKAGTNLSVEIRKKTFPATVTKMPFVKCHYYNPPK